MSLEAPGRPDVAIVGGGIVGASASMFLAEAGASVVLVERTAVGAGASGRNSGAVQHPFDPALVAMHVETLRIYRRLTDEALGFTLPAEPAGLLLVAAQAEGVEELARDIGLLHPQLHPRVLTGRELQAVEPALAAGLSACRLDTGYPVPPAAATRAIARRAEVLGARILVGAAASLQRRGDAVVGLLVDGRPLDAGAVLVAAGPWSPDVVDPSGRWRPVRPVWGVNVEVELARPPRAVIEQTGVETVATAGVAETPSQHPSEVPSMFSLITAEGSTSLGSTFLPWEPDPPALAPILRERGARFVPQLAAAPIRSVRVCARPQSADGRPLLGPMPGIAGLYAAFGHGPWGISVGPAGARLVADAILGRRAPIPEELAAARFGVPTA